MDLWVTTLQPKHAIPPFCFMTPKILTVDDSKTIRLLLARMLRPFQVEVVEGGNGEEGLQTALRERPSLIILDYNMPVMDGVMMLQQLRQNPEIQATPVIMLTAESNPKIISTVARLGVRDYIVKPFQEDLLLAKINKIVSLEPKGALPPVIPAS
jgi:two-component system cell cycle response regulator